MAERPPPLPWDRPALVPLGFQAGGALGAEALYVERRADGVLFDNLRQGKPCHVLAPRQSGKSSLLLRAKDKLLQQGWQCVSLDMRIFDTDSENEFYGGVIDRLARELELTWDVTQFRQRHLSSPSSYLWVSFLIDHLLPARRENLGLFIDEVDSLVRRPFGASEFLYGLRTAIERSAQLPLGQNPKRLLFTVCLAGVAQPMELARDSRRSLIDMGMGIDLTDFSVDEASQLLPAMAALPLHCAPQQWLDMILEWTDGHPYLTQRLCAELADSPPAQPSDLRASTAAGREFIRKEISDRVNRLFLYNQEDYLHSIKDEIESQRGTNSYRELISLYRRIYINHSEPKVDWNANDLIQQNLILHGLVKKKLKEKPLGLTTTNILVVRNRIFKEKFGVSWLAQQEHPALARFSDKMVHFFQSNEKYKFALTYKESQQLTEESNKYDLVLGRDYTGYITRSEKSRRKRWIFVRILFIIVSIGLFLGGLTAYRHNINAVDSRQQLQKKVQTLEAQVAELNQENLRLEDQIALTGNNIYALIREEHTLADQLEIQKQRILSFEEHLKVINGLLKSVRKNKRGALLHLKQQLSDAVDSLKQRNELLAQHIGELQQRVRTQRATQNRRIEQLGTEDTQTETVLRSLDMQWSTTDAQGLHELFSKVAQSFDGSTGKVQLPAEIARALRLTATRFGQSTELPFVDRLGVRGDRLAFCPQAKEQGGLFVSLDDQTLRLWTERSLSASNDNPAQVGHIGKIADPAYLAALGVCSRGLVADASGRVFIWEGRSTRPAKSIAGPVRLLSLVPSIDGELPDGLPLLSSTGGKQLARYVLKDADVKSAGVPLVHDTDVSLALLSPDGAAVVSAADRRLYLWDFVSGRQISAGSEQGAAITALALAPQDGGTTVVSGSRQGEIKKWTASRDGLLPRRAMQIHQGEVLDIVLAEHGRYIISVGSDGYIVWTDPRDGQLLFKLGPLGAEGGAPRRLGVSMDGSILLVGFSNKVRMYHIDDQAFLSLACQSLQKRSDVRREDLRAACERHSTP
jgi:hypothetical protein